MKEQLLESKLRMPGIVCNTMNRKKLLKRIHEMPEPVIALHTGVGYGKTTLMVDYFQKYRIPCAWYRLGQTDDDFHQFLHYFETLLQRQVEGFCIHEKQMDWNRDMMALTVNEILGQLELWEGSVNIVLDDLQFIQNPLILDFLSLFIRFMGEGIRIFLLIKGKFPGFLTRFVIQGTVAVLETEDLKITYAELDSHMRKLGMERSDARQIVDDTLGWAAAVNYVLMQRKKAGWSEGGISDFLGGSDFSDYLFYEVLNSLSNAQRIFMTESAVLTVMVPEICNDVLETKAAGEFLDFFVSQQLLTERVGQREYRYHPILQDYLQRQVKERRKREIWRRAAQYFCALGDAGQAGHYRELLEPKDPIQVTAETKKTQIKKTMQLTCFGGLRIHFGDEKNIIHWRTKKTKEMFAYLWEQENKPVSKERVMDALWQEGNGQRLESLYHTTLSYLKRTFSIIGITDLIQMDNKRYTMNRQCFHSDTQKLMQLHETWKNGMEGADIEREFGELNRIYQGDYMEDLEESWVLASREYYQGIYLQCCDLLVNQALRTQKYEVAVRVLEQALKIDPYSDRLNGMFLKSLCAMGEFQAAKQRYERYNRLLRDELNVGIGTQVREIYQNSIVSCTG